MKQIVFRIVVALLVFWVVACLAANLLSYGSVFPGK